MAPNTSRGPVEPQPAALPGLARVPAVSGAPPPSARPRGRPGAERRGVAGVRRGKRGSPGEPSTLLRGRKRVSRAAHRPSLARHGPPWHSPPWRPPALLPGCCGPRPAWARCPPLGFRRAARTLEASRSRPAPGHARPERRNRAERSACRSTRAPSRDWSGAGRGWPSHRSPTAALTSAKVRTLGPF